MTEVVLKICVKHDRCSNKNCVKDDRSSIKNCVKEDRSGNKILCERR